MIQVSYHLYNSMKNISRTVIIHSEKNQNKGPRRNFTDHPIDFSHLHMTKWSPREDRDLSHHLLYQLESYDPSPSDPPYSQYPKFLASSMTLCTVWPMLTSLTPHYTRLLSLLSPTAPRCCSLFPLLPPSSGPFPLLLGDSHLAVIS